MKTTLRHPLRTHVAALMLLAPLGVALVAPPAAAQQRAVVAGPVISSMAINSSAGLAPGATLRVQLYATPGANWAQATLGGSGVSVPLREVSPGNYVGTHVVRRGERIDPTERITMRADYRGRVIAAAFNYPPSFQALAMGSPPSIMPVVEIERFVVRPMGRLAPGRELRFRLEGAPGAQAWVTIPGVVRSLALAETRRGTYEGSYTIRRGDNLDAFERAVATLQRGPARATARLDLGGGGWDRDDRWGRDHQGPVISDLTPDHGDRVSERGRTRISARLEDDRSGVDPSSVRLRLNGRDVTSAAQVSADSVLFREDLAPGRYTAQLSVRDRAGNASQRTWSFDVVDRDRYGWGYGR